MTKDYPWMIYGATGLSGELIARKAVAQRLRPTLAGRDAKAVQKIAEELNLSWRVFEVSDWGRFRREISTVNLLVNAAGPLMQTSVLVAETCLATHTHYFDLSNHVPSLVAIYTLDGEAKKKEVTLLPGLAFSPAVSNCLVQHLHRLLPDADAVEIALAPFMRTPSPGANLTITESLAQGGFRRRYGVLERCWPRSGFIEVKLPRGHCKMLPAALGDVETAFRSTKLPNISTYIVADTPSPSRDLWPASWRSSKPFLQSEGSTTHFDDRPGAGHSLVWARMSKLGHRSLEGWIELGEGYEFTAAVILGGVSRLLTEEGLSTGVHTPATALGADFILDLPNVRWAIQPMPQEHKRARKRLDLIGE